MNNNEPFNKLVIEANARRATIQQTQDVEEMRARIEKVKRRILKAEKELIRIGRELKTSKIIFVDKENPFTWDASN